MLIFLFFKLIKMKIHDEDSDSQAAVLTSSCVSSTWSLTEPLTFLVQNMFRDRK